jgi:hypothetical protein
VTVFVGKFCELWSWSLKQRPLLHPTLDGGALLVLLFCFVGDRLNGTGSTLAEAWWLALRPAVQPGWVLTTMHQLRHQLQHATLEPGVCSNSGWLGIQRGEMAGATCCTQCLCHWCSLAACSGRTNWLCKPTRNIGSHLQESVILCVILCSSSLENTTHHSQALPHSCAFPSSLGTPLFSICCQLLYMPCRCSSPFTAGSTSWPQMRILQQYMINFKTCCPALHNPAAVSNCLQMCSRT